MSTNQSFDNPGLPTEDDQAVVMRDVHRALSPCRVYRAIFLVAGYRVFNYPPLIREMRGHGRSVIESLENIAPESDAFSLLSLFFGRERPIKNK